MGLAGRREQDGKRLGIVSGQMPPQGSRHVPPARHQGQCIVVSQHIGQEGVHAKVRMHRCHHAGNGARYVRAVLDNEGFGHDCQKQ